LETILVFSALLFTFAVLIQAVLYGFSAHVVASAAREGARAARLSGDPAIGRQQAERFLARFGSETVTNRQVSVNTDGRTMTVAVTGRAAHVLPGFAPGVDGRSTGPIERFEPGR
jgi:hypothetical protein